MRKVKKELVGYSWRILAALLTLGAVSCAPDESIPTMRSSAGSSMDGSHFVPFSGAPDEISQTPRIDSNYSPGGWSTPPVPLYHPYGFAIGSRNGRVFVFNDHDSLRTTIDLGEHEVIDQLLADQMSIYIITVTGNLFAYSPDGRQQWKSNAGGMLTGPAVIANDRLILPKAEHIVAKDVHSGSSVWEYVSTLRAVSLAVGPNGLYAALSNGQVEKTDSIVVFNSAGSVNRRWGLPGLRITSNIALCGEKKNTLAVGVLGEATGQRRQSYLLAYSNIDQATPELLWKHPLPYLVLSVGANANSIVGSGFRTLESDMVSGADAFALADTSQLWSRRFTQPLATPLAVSNGNIYFTLSFQSEAIVAGRALFYTLSSGTGSTVSERAIKGADAFVPGMPIPDEQGRFLIADRDKLVVYILDRSTLKRVF